MEKTGGKRDLNYGDIEMKDTIHKEQNWKDEIWGKNIYSKDRLGI